MDTHLFRPRVLKQQESLKKHKQKREMAIQKYVDLEMSAILSLACYDVAGLGLVQNLDLLTMMPRNVMKQDILPIVFFFFLFSLEKNILNTLSPKKTAKSFLFFSSVRSGLR